MVFIKAKLGAERNNIATNLIGLIQGYTYFKKK